MDRFYVQLNIGKILGEQDKGQGPTLTRAQIHEIGVEAVKKALGPQLTGSARGLTRLSRICPTMSIGSRTSAKSTPAINLGPSRIARNFGSRR